MGDTRGVSRLESDHRPSAAPPAADPGATDPAQPTPPANLSLLGWLRWIWRTLTMMRTALVLLLLLTLATIPGSLFPQRVADPLAVNQFLSDNPTWGPIADSLGLLDVYASPWFAAIYVLLFISLLGCVIPRIGQLYRQWREGPPEPPGRLSNRSGARSIPAGADTLDRAARNLADQGWRVNGDATRGWVSAEKGFLREAGNLGFHLSLLAMLIAVGIGGSWGWRGNVIVQEGDGFANTLTQYDAWGGGRFVDPAELSPFAFTLEDFSVDFERGEAQRGAPRDFTAVLDLVESPDADPRQVVLQVNDPLTLDRAKVFLIGHGYAPRFVVRDPAGAVVFDDAVSFLPQDSNFTSTGVIKVPDMGPQLGVNGIFAPTAVVDDRGPVSVFPAPDDPAVFLAAFSGYLGIDDGEPQSVYRLDTSAMEQVGLRGMIPGETWTLDDGTEIEFTGIDRWVSLQVSHDPGRLWALLAATLIMAGLGMSLFVPRRRIWLRSGNSADGAPAITAVGLARTENARPDDDIDSLLAALTDDATTGGAP